MDGWIVWNCSVIMLLRACRYGNECVQKMQILQNRRGENIKGTKNNALSKNLNRCLGIDGAGAPNYNGVTSWNEKLQ